MIRDNITHPVAAAHVCEMCSDTSDVACLEHALTSDMNLPFEHAMQIFVLYTYIDETTKRLFLWQISSSWKLEKETEFKWFFFRSAWPKNARQFTTRSRELTWRIVGEVLQEHKASACLLTLITFQSVYSSIITIALDRSLIVNQRKRNKELQQLRNR